MSLRVIVQPQHIQDWITKRNGTPARIKGTNAELRILFGAPVNDVEPLPMDEFLQILHDERLVMLVDEEPQKVFHKFIQRG
jgi:hypothetical protein